ncbi:MAG TPA: DinB family protein [Candidatus Udaeobacter sp.]|nr:DinB family protein [Candidatus Udaeobacter sp.]
MKLMLLVVAMLLIPMVDQTLSPAERDHAVAELESSRKAFLEATSGLSEAQWNFKPAPDRWSIAECAEHIGVTEAYILSLITEQALKGPAEPEKRAQVQGKDTSMMAMAVDRSTKFKAPEPIQPTRRWVTSGEITKNVLENRARTIAFVNTTQEDLRDHFMDHPVFKTLDTYQWILLTSAHMRRHTAQILEVKADPNFPKR